MMIDSMIALDWHTCTCSRSAVIKNLVVVRAVAWLGFARQ